MRNLDEFIRDLYKKHKVFGTSKICVQTPEIFVIMRGMGLSIEIAKNEIINDDVNLAWTQDWNIDRVIFTTKLKNTQVPMIRGLVGIVDRIEVRDDDVYGAVRCSLGLTQCVKSCRLTVDPILNWGDLTVETEPGKLGFITATLGKFKVYYRDLEIELRDYSAILLKDGEYVKLKRGDIVEDKGRTVEIRLGEYELPDRVAAMVGAEGVEHKHTVIWKLSLDAVNREVTVIK